MLGPFEHYKKGLLVPYTTRQAMCMRFQSIAVRRIAFSTPGNSVLRIHEACTQLRTIESFTDVSFGIPLVRGSQSLRCGRFSGRSMLKHMFPAKKISAPNETSAGIALHVRNPLSPIIGKT